MVWHYAGYCRAARESAIVFSVDAENNIPFKQLECFAYDLLQDPKRTHRIRPNLLSPDGVSKKLEAPFLAPITASQPFAVEFHCKLPNCIKGGVQYHTASLSFDQETLNKFEVRLLFEKVPPDYVHAYAHEPGAPIRMVKDLRPTQTEKNHWEYIDTDDSVPGQSSRIYVFNRPPG